MSKKTDIVLAAQREAKTNNPEASDIYSVGTLAASFSCFASRRHGESVDRR